MGNLATRFPKKKIKWDGENMKVTNPGDLAIIRAIAARRREL